MNNDLEMIMGHQATIDALVLQVEERRAALKQAKADLEEARQNLSAYIREIKDGQRSLFKPEEDE